ncbi:MAG: carbamoyltransferase HypF, partial [Bacteroidetes bacterium]
RLLEGSAAPLVLLPLKEKTASGICTELLAPGLDHIGVMLPYAPLLDLLAREVGLPLVATSGNMSGSPIFFTDAQALKHLGQVADAFLTHNRDIVLPQDDSVIHIAGNQPIILRRSRGLAPTFFNPQTDAAPQGSVLALGAQQKSTFCWQQGNNVYISPYLGDMDSADTQERFDYVLRHFEQLLDTQPQQLLADKHPGYYTSELAQELSARWQIPLLQVQHHKAHAAAVLGEHGLNRSQKPVMAVVWDGTGLGEDGQIWGGEFFICEKGKIRRFAHLGYFDALLGDKMPREPRLSALSLCKELPEGHSLLKPHFSPQAWDLYQRMLAQPGSLKTSSMGRFFDGVACLLGLPAQVSFEGEAAMQIEALARRGFRKGAIPEGLTGSYLGDKLPLSGTEIAPAHILRPLLAHLLAGGDPAEIAARFHLSLVQLIRDVARQSACTGIAFSGGVFQNTLLIHLINKHLRTEFTLHFHQQLSPNDENISYGQLQYFIHHL